MARKKKQDDLSPWAKYQREHKKDNLRRSSQSKPSKSKSLKITSLNGFQERIRNWFAKVPNWFKNIRLREFNVFTVSLIVLALVVITCVGYLFTPLSRVQSVSVEGNKRVADSAILKKSGLKKNQLLVVNAWNRAKTESKIKKDFSDIEKVSLVSKEHNRVQIDVTENAVMGYVVRNGLYYTVRQDGTTTGKHTTQPSGNYPIFRDFKQNATLRKFLRKYAAVPNSVQNSISEVDYMPTKDIPNRIQLYMNDGNEVYAIIDTFDKKMKYYPEISASMKQKGIINFEVGAYSYPFSMRNQENATSDNSTTTKKQGATKKSKNTSDKVKSSQSQSTQKTF